MTEKRSQYNQNASSGKRVFITEKIMMKRTVKQFNYRNSRSNED